MTGGDNLKEKSESVQRKAGVVLSYAHIFFTIISGLLYTPFMIRTLGQNEYGLYGTVNAAVSMLTVLDLGLTSSYIRFYSKYKAENNQEKINSFNSLFLLAFSLISAITLAIGLFFSFNLNLIFDKGLNADEYSKAKIMFILLTASTVLKFFTMVFFCYIIANEKFIVSKSLTLLFAILTVVFSIISLCLGFGAIGIVVVTVSMTVLQRLVEAIYSVSKLHLRFDFRHIERGLFSQLFVYSGLIAINTLVDKVNSGIDSVLLGRFCGTAVVAVYSVGAALYNHFITFSGAISGIFTPHVHKLVNSCKQDSAEQRKALTEIFTKVGRIQYLVLALIASGFVFFGKPFIRIWAGDGYDKAYIIALLLILPSIPPLIQNVGIEIQRAENRHHYRSYIYGGMALGNFVLSIFLCQIYEGIGCAIGTAVSIIIANIFIMNIVYHKKINIDVIYFWKSILRQTAGMIIPFAVGLAIMKFIEIKSIIGLAAAIILYTVVYVICVYLFSMNEYEKELVKGFLRKLKIIK